MRVAIVGEFPLDGTRIWGGVEAAFAYLVKELARLEELDLHVIVLGNPARAAQTNLANGVTLHILPTFPRFELARNFQTYQCYLDRKLAEIKPDLVHAQGAADHAYVALRSGYPTVITVHGVQSEESKHQASVLKGARRWIFGRWIEPYNLSHTRHLIAIGRYVVDYFRRFLSPETRVYYIPNAIDERYFQLANQGNGSVILYAGRVIQRKRLLDLIRAFERVIAQIPSAQLRVAGEFDSEPSYANQVRSAIARAHLEGRVVMLGGLSEDQVRQEFAACDVLALPSIQETTPMVIAQAMAAGKPVVATPVGGVAEMVREAVTGFLVPVGNIQSLSEALLCLLRDPALRLQMGQAGRDIATCDYLASNVARKTRDVYSKIAATSHPARIPVSTQR